MDKQEQKGRDSIWGVNRETKGLYFIVFITLALIGGGLVTYTEVHVNKADGIVDTALAAWAGVGRLVIASVAGSLIVTEVWRNGMVLAERLEEWFDKRRERQIAKAVAEAEEKTRAEIGSLWQAWNMRRIEAETLGEPFDEPPPSL